MTIPLAPGSEFLTPTEPRDDFIWTNRSWDPPSHEGLVAWGCLIGIYAGLGSNNSYTERVVFRDCVLADNGTHAQLACTFIVDNSLIVHDSGNGIFGQQSGHGFQQGFAQALYDGPGQMYDCYLVGYDGPGGHSIFFDGVGGASVRHTNHLVAGLSYEGGGAPKIDFADCPSRRRCRRGYGESSSVTSTAACRPASTRATRCSPTTRGCTSWTPTGVVNHGSARPCDAPPAARPTRAVDETLRAGASTDGRSDPAGARWFRSA